MSIVTRGMGTNQLITSGYGRADASAFPVVVGGGGGGPYPYHLSWHQRVIDISNRREEKKKEKRRKWLPELPAETAPQIRRAARRPKGQFRIGPATEPVVASLTTQNSLGGGGPDSWPLAIGLPLGILVSVLTVLIITD